MLRKQIKMAVNTVFFLLSLIYQQVTSQPDTMYLQNTSHSALSAEDILGSSLLQSPEEIVSEEDNTLGTSLVFSTELSQKDELGTSLLCQSTKEQSENQSLNCLGSSLLYSPAANSDTPDKSFTRFEEEAQWLSELKETIRGPHLSSTPLKARRELQFDRVMAKQKPAKQLNSYLCKEVQGAKKLKLKAMDPQHIKGSMKQKCLCGQICMKKVSYITIKNLRLSYWSQSVTVRRQLLKLYVKRSSVKGKHRFVNIDENLDVCSKSFLNILRINKNAFSRATRACEKDEENTPGRCPRKANENSLTAINWLEDYASFYGDRMPNSQDVKLPYKFRKLSVYGSYHTDVEKPVSKSQFFKIWRLYFPHLKIKRTNSFSKCATCTMLEKHRENAVDYETKAMYGQLKDEHHERQHMERRYYYGKRDASRKCPLQSMSLIIDGMDQAKTNLPHFTGRISKDVNPADLLKTRVTGVLNHGAGGFHTYVDVNEYPHDPNLTINVLLKALKRAADSNDNTLPPVLYVQADNCGRENKNKYVLAFLELLVQQNIFHEVHLSFLYVGHTHEDIDAAFSKVSQKIKGFDLETLPELVNILPNPEEIGQIYDVKAWMEPYLAVMSQISFPLHYKFEKDQETVKMFYKGPHYLNWISVEEKILSGVPNGKPKTVNPDYSKIDTERNLKQIKKLRNLFKNPHAVEYWEEFYSNIKDSCRSIKGTKWLLEELPRQGEQYINIESIQIPEHIRNIMDKETAVPQVIVKRKKKQVTRQPGKKKSSQGSRPNPPKQRKQKGQQRQRLVHFCRVVVIPLTDEVKQHIWLFIFICFLEMIISVLALFVMVLLMNLYSVLTVVKFLDSLFQTLLIVHAGHVLANVKSIVSMTGFSLTSLLVETM